MLPRTLLPTRGISRISRSLVLKRLQRLCKIACEPPACQSGGRCGRHLREALVCCWETRTMDLLCQPHPVLRTPYVRSGQLIILVEQRYDTARPWNRRGKNKRSRDTGGDSRHLFQNFDTMARASIRSLAVAPGSPNSDEFGSTHRWQTDGVVSHSALQACVRSMRADNHYRMRTTLPQKTWSGVVVPN